MQGPPFDSLVPNHRAAAPLGRETALPCRRDGGSVEGEALLEELPPKSLQSVWPESDERAVER
jgi:hypothetical protein